jgi:CheY-like chemotaxis protein
LAKEIDLLSFKIQKLESFGILADGNAFVIKNLLAEIKGQNLQKQKELNNEVIKAAQRAAGLTRQLLTFAKDGFPNMVVGSIIEIIRNVIDSVLEKSFTVICETFLSDNLWLIEMDAGQIEQVMQNIITNALQAMPEGGVIKITANNLVDSSGNRFVHVSINDTGIGIPAKYLTKIFDPYFTTKNKQGSGSGLGLTICYSVIKNHRGSITVESKQEEGSTFNIFLPATKKKKAVIRKEAEERGEITYGFKIMIMDDEDFIREMLEEMLQGMGHKIETAQCGEEVLEKYSSATKTNRPFDLFILDLNVPGKMGGVETLQKLLQIDPSIKTIVSSGYSDTIPKGFSGALAKPYTIKQLEEVIKQTMA